VALYEVVIRGQLSLEIVRTELIAFVIDEATLKLCGYAVPETIDIGCKL
jgi:hypothetical protein